MNSKVRISLLVQETETCAAHGLKTRENSITHQRKSSLAENRQRYLSDPSFELQTQTLWPTTNLTLFFLFSTEFGAAFIVFGVAFFFFGVFTFFDAALLALGNILLLVGLTLVIGPQKTLNYFLRPSKLRGTVCFAVGILMIFLKHAFIGFAIESVGILFLFGDVLNLIVTFLRSMPVIGPILNHPSVAPYVDRMANVNVLPV